MNNYTPISVLFIVAKQWKSWSIINYVDILRKMTCLKTSQHRFRPNHSTVTAMLEIVNKWFHNIDIRQLSGVVFLDLRKAFDTVDHQILLRKLYMVCGIPQGSIVGLLFYYCF